MDSGGVSASSEGSPCRMPAIWLGHVSEGQCATGSSSRVARLQLVGYAENFLL